MDAVLFTNARVRRKQLCCPAREAKPAVSSALNSPPACGPCRICGATRTCSCKLPCLTAPAPRLCAMQSDADLSSGLRAGGSRGQDKVMQWAEFQARLRRAKSRGQGLQHMFCGSGRLDGGEAGTPAPRSPLARSKSGPCGSLRAGGATVAATEVSEDSVARLVIDAMQDGNEDAAAQERGLRSLIALAGGERRREAVGNAGGVRAAVGALERFPADENVQILGLHMLASLCVESPTNRRVAGESRAVGVLVALLQGHEEQKPEVVEHTLRALYLCCKACEPSQVLAGECGGVAVTVAIMRRHKDKYGIQMHCLRALEALARDNDGNQGLIRRASGGEEVLCAMRSNRDCQITQELATDVLAILLCGDEETQAKLGAEGGVEDIVHALRVALDSPPAVATACTCLRYLAFEAENRARTSACDGVQAIMEAADRMRASTTDVVTAVLLALGNLTFDDEVNKSVAAKRGGVSTLISIMAVREDEADIVECAIRVLRNISDSRQGAKKSCYKHGAVAAVAAAMRHHVECAGIQEHGAAMLINMLNGFPFAVRAAKLDDHLATVCDVHSLADSTFVQVHHLGSELAKRAATSLSGLLGRRLTATMRAPSPSTSAVAIGRAQSSTAVGHGLGRLQSTAATGLSPTSSNASSLNSKPSGSRRSSSAATVDAGECDGAPLAAVEPHISEEMMEY
jgi:hypothetical protein